MAAQPDPKPVRVRGPLPTTAELGGTCQVCGWNPPPDKQYAPYLERMHLLRGAHKEDDPNLIMVGCGDYGQCRIHPRLDREADPEARHQVRAAMTAAQSEAVIARRGTHGLDDLYPAAPIIENACPVCGRRQPEPPARREPRKRGSWGKLLGPLPADEHQREAFETLINACRDELVRMGLKADDMHGGFYVLLPVLHDWLSSREQLIEEAT